VEICRVAKAFFTIALRGVCKRAQLVGEAVDVLIRVIVCIFDVDAGVIVL
jgi:hypothetical protein